MKLLTVGVILLVAAQQCILVQPRKVSQANLLDTAGLQCMIGKTIGDLIGAIEPEYRTILPYSRRPAKPRIHIDGFTVVYASTDSTDIRVQILVDSMKYVRKGDGKKSYSLGLIMKERISGLNVVLSTRMADRHILFYNEFLQDSVIHDARGR